LATTLGPLRESLPKAHRIDERPILPTCGGAASWFNDPFLGSGTTLAASELTERVYYGVELDPKYGDVVIQRWQTHWPRVGGQRLGLG
jgi:hypothetical protein